MKSDISIEKFDIFEHNGIQNVLNYDHYFCVFFHSVWDTAKTWFLNSSSGNENRWPRIFFLMCGNKNKSLGAKSGLYGGWPINSTFWPVKKAPVSADVWELALLWWTMIRLLLFVFRISTKNLGKQNWPSYNAQVGQLRHDQFFGLFSKTHTVDCCCFGLICIDPWFVTCDDLINVFWSTTIVFSNISYANWREHFFERLSNCAGSNENKSFLRPGGHAILNVCWWKKCPRMPLSHGRSILLYQFKHGMYVVWHNGCFCTNLTDIVF